MQFSAPWCQWTFFLFSHPCRNPADWPTPCALSSLAVQSPVFRNFHFHFNNFHLNSTEIHKVRLQCNWQSLAEKLMMMIFSFSQSGWFSLALSLSLWGKNLSQFLLSQQWKKNSSWRRHFARQTRMISFENCSNNLISAGHSTVFSYRRVHNDNVSKVTSTS